MGKGTAPGTGASRSACALIDSLGDGGGVGAFVPGKNCGGGAVAFIVTPGIGKCGSCT